MAEDNRESSGKPLTNRWMHAMYIGFFAGLIWGALKILLYLIKFTKVIPGFLAEPFFKNEFLKTWNGHVIGLLFFIVFSIAAALLYTALFVKHKGPWIGLFYGLAWWAVLYLLVGPPSGMMKSIRLLDTNTLLADLCLFTLWGVFIGFSISYEFTDERVREPGALGSNR
ncbi:YqhR family membrane protein [Ferviditalea candida]|uniref:YqhR family membrane protein n=1 Tax=Ferviditalea candida TaxID=3108399 RepID=A0ABU5ZIE2_9BACL|nr:YqhR family membrane protein [Paenibacillaceae bacterium T2]